MKCRVLIAQKFASLGGAQVSLVHTLALLDHTQFEPHVVVSNEGWLTGKLTEMGIPWTLLAFGHWTNLASLPRNLLLVSRLQKYIRQHGIQLVHANEHWVAPPCYWAARKAGIPALCHFRTGLDDLTPRRIKKYLYGRFDRVILVAEVLRRAMAEHVSDPARLVVVRDGVEPFPGKPRYWSQRRTRILINVGAIYDVKGQAIILDRALPWLKSNRRHFLLFVGGTRKDSSYVEDMKQVVAAQGLNRQVLFLGSRQDVARLLGAADALVAYSTVEGVPRVVMEAMLAGRPVLVSNTSGMDEVVTDGEVGRILNFDDAANPLSQALHDLSARPAAWENMGRRGREQAQARYSTRAMADAIQTIYTDLTRAKKHE